MEGMMMFHQLFPDIGLEETRTITVFKERDGWSCKAVGTQDKLWRAYAVEQNP